MNFKITGTGSYAPTNTVSNDDLAKFLDTSDEWITQRVGVRTRRVSTGETAADFAAKAAQNALEMSGIDAKDLDLIVAASLSSDFACPTVAGTVQAKIGANCPAFDVNSACSGFLFALDTAAGFFARGTAKKALVIGAERISKILDWTDRSTAVIFGDGAGAAVLEASEDGYLASTLYTQGGDDVIRIPNTHGTSPYFKPETEDTPYIYMNGQETFKFAVNVMCRDVNIVLDKANLKIDDIKYFVPHQANMRILRFVEKKLKIAPDKIFANLEHTGNTSAASVPMALDELNRSGNLKKGDLVLLSAFGGGLSSAACILRW